MAKATTKKKVTAEQYEAARAGYFKAESEATALVAKRDVAVNKLNEKFNPKFEELQQAQEEHFAVIQQYCEDNRDTLLPDGAKSISVVGGTIGFRSGTPKLLLLADVTGDKEAEKAMWENALGKVKRHLPDYIQVTEAIAKSKIITDRELPIVLRALPKCGLTIDQQEVFFIRPTKTKK